MNLNMSLENSELRVIEDIASDFEYFLENKLWDAAATVARAAREISEPDAEKLYKQLTEAMRKDLADKKQI